MPIYQPCINTLTFTDLSAIPALLLDITVLPGQDTGFVMHHNDIIVEDAALYARFDTQLQFQQVAFDGRNAIGYISDFQKTVNNQFLSCNAFAVNFAIGGPCMIIPFPPQGINETITGNWIYRVKNNSAVNQARLVVNLTGFYS